MSEPKRYTCGPVGMIEDADGEWVSFSDYEAMNQNLREALRESDARGVARDRRCMEYEQEIGRLKGKVAYLLSEAHNNPRKAMDDEPLGTFVLWCKHQGGWGATQCQFFSVADNIASQTLCAHNQDRFCTNDEMRRRMFARMMRETRP